MDFEQLKMYHIVENAFKAKKYSDKYFPEKFLSYHYET